VTSPTLISTTGSSRIEFCFRSLIERKIRVRGVRVSSQRTEQRVCVTGSLIGVVGRRHSKHDRRLDSQFLTELKFNGGVLGSWRSGRVEGPSEGFYFKASGFSHTCECAMTHQTLPSLIHLLRLRCRTLKLRQLDRCGTNSVEPNRHANVTTLLPHERFLPTTIALASANFIHNVVLHNHILDSRGPALASPPNILGFSIAGVVLLPQTCEAS
jgi:hypothetical protein